MVILPVTSSRDSSPGEVRGRLGNTAVPRGPIKQSLPPIGTVIDGASLNSCSVRARECGASSFQKTTRLLVFVPLHDHFIALLSSAQAHRSKLGIF